MLERSLGVVIIIDLVLSENFWYEGMLEVISYHRNCQLCNTALVQCGLSYSLMVAIGLILSNAGDKAFPWPIPAPRQLSGRYGLR